MGAKFSKKSKGGNNAGVAAVEMQPQNVQREEDKRRIAELEARITELEIELKAAQANSKGKEDNENLNNNNNKIDNDNEKRLKAELEEARQLFKQCKAEYEEKLLKFKNDVEKAKQNVRKSMEIRSNDAEVIKLKSDLKDQQDNSAKLKANYDAETTRLKGELKEAQTNIGNLRDEIKQLRQRVKDGGSASGDSNEQELVKLRKQLKEEQDLSASLRKELNERTKANLAATSRAQVQTSSPVVLNEAAEYMKMNEIELRSKISLLNHDMQLQLEKQATMRGEIDRLSKQNEGLADKIQGKDKVIKT